ncbi:MAG: inositol monophosphatase family protein [Silvanigrellaceae bacterium]
MTSSQSQPSAVNLPTRGTIGELARAAGTLTNDYFRRQIRVDEKSGDLGLVTEADLASEKFLKTEIAKLFPNHWILGEESGWTSVGTGDAPQDGDAVWILDPIDGTTNFSKGNIFHCISVACGRMNGSRFECERAAIYQPGTGDLYTAARGQGAFVNDEPISVLAGDEPRRWSLATGFSSNKGSSLHGVIRCIETLQNKILGMRINGAAALDLALTGRGVFNGFFESRLSPWDMAAGELIVREAGGIVVNYEGQPFDVLVDKHIVAGPRHVVNYLLETLSGLRGELKDTSWP